MRGEERAAAAAGNAGRPDRPELLRGTLDLLLLCLLARGPDHGYALARSLEARSGGVLSVEEGALYPALQRLRRAGMVEASWRTGPTGRRVRTYALTPTGQRARQTQTALWRELTEAMARIMD